MPTGRQAPTNGVMFKFDTFEDKGSVMHKQFLFFLILTSFCTSTFSQSNSGKKNNRFRTTWIKKSERIGSNYEGEKNFVYTTSFLIESQTITIESEDSTIGQKMIYYKDRISTKDGKIVTYSGHFEGKKEEIIFVINFTGDVYTRKISNVMMFVGDLKYQFYIPLSNVEYY